MRKWRAAEGNGWKQHRVATSELRTATKVATEVTGGGDEGDDDTGNNYKD